MSGHQATAQPKWPGFAKQGMRFAANEAKSLYKNPATEFLPALNRWTTQGWENQANIAQGGNSIANPGLAEAGKILSGGYLDVTQDPNFQRNIQAALGATSDRFAGSGRVGSGSYAGALADSATGVAGQMYNAERNRQTNILGMLPNLIGSQYADVSALQAAGQAMDADTQARFDWPYARLDRYANTLYGSPASQIPGQRTSTPFNWTDFALGALSPMR